MNKSIESLQHTIGNNAICSEIHWYICIDYMHGIGTKINQGLFVLDRMWSNQLNHNAKTRQKTLI